MPKLSQITLVTVAAMAPGLFLAVMLGLQSGLALECTEDDRICLRQCKPGSIGEVQSRVVQAECPRPMRTKLDSQLRCWIGKVPANPESVDATEITNTSALLTWKPPAEWSANITGLRYDCRLVMEKYLVTLIDQQALETVQGNAPAFRRTSPGGPRASAVNTAARVEGLRPNQTYNCFVWAQVNDIQGAKTAAKVKTLPGVPAFPVGKLQFSYSLENDDIIIHWEKDRPTSDPVTGFKLTVGNSVQTLDQNMNRYDIDAIRWNKLIGSSGLVNISIAPINAFGMGPVMNASIMIPPYDDYNVLTSNGCSTQDQVYAFEKLPVNAEAQKVCYGEAFYQECVRRDP